MLKGMGIDPQKIAGDIAEFVKIAKDVQDRLIRIEQKLDAGASVNSNQLQLELPENER